MILATFSSCCCCCCCSCCSFCCSFCSKGSSRTGKGYAFTAAAAKLRNTWRHQPLLQYCLYLLLLLLVVAGYSRLAAAAATATAAALLLLLWKASQDPLLKITSWQGNTMPLKDELVPKPPKNSLTRRLKS